MARAEGNCADRVMRCVVGYVGVRVVHSLVQAITNKIMLRLGLFAISSFVLAGLTAKSAQVLFF